MKKILGAIGMGILAGVAIGGYMSWKRNKKVQEKVDEVFDEEFVNNVVEKTTENLKDINNQVQEDIQKSFDELGKTKNDILNNIKERHEKLDEEIKKMEENTGNLEKTVEELHNDKIVPPVVEEIKISAEEKENHNKNMKILEETEKKLDDLLEDLAK